MPNKSTVDELYKINPSGVIALYELDLSEILFDKIELESQVLHFYSGKNFNYEPLSWGGNEYMPIPAEGIDFGYDSQRPPRPKIRVANYKGYFSQVLNNINIEGARFTRILVPIKNLPPENFQGNINPFGIPDEDTIEPSIFIVDRKTSEDIQVIEYELAIPLDIEESRLPSCQVLSAVCRFDYRGAGCNYSGGRMFTKDNRELNIVNRPKDGDVVNHTTYIVHDGEVYFFKWQPNPVNQSIIYFKNSFNTSDVKFKKLTTNGEYPVWSVGTTYEFGDVVQVLINGRPPFFIICKSNHLSAIPHQNYANLRLWRRDECGKTVESCQKRFGLAIPFGGYIGVSILPFNGG